jgi:eukaryotic-like serine/threonine-protein kinase
MLHQDITIGDTPQVEPVKLLGERRGVAVWEARHQQTGATIALRVFTGRRMQDAAYGRAFRRRQRSVARLGHGRILTPLAVFAVDSRLHAAGDGRMPLGAPGVVLPWAAGGVVADQPGLTWAPVASVLHALLDALAHAHARDVLHLGITPRNLLLTDGPAPMHERLRLADFAVVGRHPADPRDAPSGTVGSAPPEQIDGDWSRIGPWTDLYALGCAVWSLVCGSGPFEGPNRRATRFRQLQDTPNPFIPQMAVPPGLEMLLRRLISRHPESRPQTAAAARRELDRDAGPTVSPPTDSLLDGPTLSLQSPLVPDPTEEAPRPRPRGWRGTPTPPAPAGSPQDLPLARLREPPLVARAPQRDQLWAMLEEVGDHGTARVVIVQGPPGSGRRRLAHWLATRAKELDVVDAVVHVHHDDDADGGLAAAARRALRIDRADDPSEASHRAVGRLRLLDDWLAEDLPRWLVPGKQPPAAGVHVLMGGLLRALSRSRPVLTVVDNAGESAETCATIASIIARQPAEPTPALFVLTAAEADHLTATFPEATVLDLPPLEAPEVQELVAWMHPVSAAAAREVHRRTGGHPLVALQLASLLAEDAIQHAPSSIHATWQARLTHALDDPDERRVVERAATLGMRVSLDDLSAAWGAPLPANLGDRLEDAGLAQPTAQGWRFAHESLRDMVIAEASAPMTEHHRACAAALNPEPDDALGFLRVARHRMGAGDTDGAWRDAMTAGRLLLSAGRNGQATTAFSLASAALADHRPNVGGRRLAETRLQQRLSEMQSPGWIPAPDALEAILATVGMTDWADLQAHTYRALAETREALGQLEEADAAWVRAAARADEVGLDEVSARARLGRARLAATLGDTDGAATLARAVLALPVPDGAPEVPLQARALEARLALDRGDRVEAGAAARRLLHEAAEPPFPPALAAARRALGWIAVRADRPEEAQRQFTAWRSMARRTGDLPGIAAATASLAAATRLAGDLDQAEVLAHKAGHWAQVAGTSTAPAQVELARTQLRQGANEAARLRVHALLGSAQDSGNRGVLAACHATLAAAAAAEGDWMVFDLSLNELDDTPTGVHVAPDLELAAQHAHRHGAPERARRARALATAYRR